MKAKSFFILFFATILFTQNQMGSSLKHLKRSPAMEKAEESKEEQKEEKNDENKNLVTCDKKKENLEKEIEKLLNDKKDILAEIKEMKDRLEDTLSEYIPNQRKLNYDSSFYPQAFIQPADNSFILNQITNMMMTQQQAMEEIQLQMYGLLNNQNNFNPYDMSTLHNSYPRLNNSSGLINPYTSNIGINYTDMLSHQSLYQYNSSHINPYQIDSLAEQNKNNIQFFPEIRGYNLDRSQLTQPELLQLERQTF